MPSKRPARAEPAAETAEGQELSEDEDDYDGFTFAHPVSAETLLRIARVTHERTGSPSHMQKATG